jgi:hypothetical protein
MTSDQRWAVSDISCGECGSTNLLDLGAGPADPRRHSFVCKDCGNYFEYPPRSAHPEPEAAPLLRPSSEALPPDLEAVGLASLAALEDRTAYESLELVCRNLVGILRSVRANAEESASSRAMFNEVCQAVEEWVETELGELRFRD